jgi:hypothetical protein
MANGLDQKEVVTIDELTLSNAWELEALVEVLTAKGVITKREVLDMLTKLPHRNPAAAAPYSDLTADPNKTDILVKHILDVFNSTGLTAQQAKDVLTHLQSPCRNRRACRTGEEGPLAKRRHLCRR